MRGFARARPREAAPDPQSTRPASGTSGAASSGPSPGRPVPAGGGATIEVDLVGQAGQDAAGGDADAEIGASGSRATYRLADGVDGGAAM